MSLPQIAPYPPASVRKSLPPNEWEACLDAWLSLTDLYLRANAKDFASAAQNELSLIGFLRSFYHEESHEHHRQGPTSTKQQRLRKTAFLLTHRTMFEPRPPPATLLEWDFLADFSHVYMKTQSLEALLRNLWRQHGSEIERSLQRLKASFVKALESSQSSAGEGSVKQLAPLIYASADTGAFLMRGSDFIDAAASSYESSRFRQDLVTLCYLGLISLTKGEKPNHSILFDHLYSLKAVADKFPPTQPSLLSDLVTNTPLLSKLQTAITGKDAERARKLAETLSPLRSPAIARRRPTRRRVYKGKGKDTYGHGAINAEQHIHRMSLITQIQDLFPDLGSGFISALLDEYSESVETVTAHLLDDSLPPHLRDLDRSAQLSAPPPTEQQRSDHLAPRSTPPPQRRNVFDNDEFDRLEVEASRLHIGRRNERLTADAIMSDRSTAPRKSAILSALAAFDSDDDERDDTYDVEDVGGTVDAARPGGETERDVDAAGREDGANEEALWRAWKLDHATFGRSAEVRRCNPRQALKNETGMTDEAIEGWAVMLERDPRRLKRLEAKFGTWDGQQRDIGRSRWVQEDEESDTGGSGAERGGFRGRGRGRGRGGGGRGRGNVAGPASERGTQQARDRKEASKGSRANHNRRDQRARKMARGGFPG
ncbi:hypothetical protein M8818_000182 [Zalaria obscura]|uniref:Uncharacterized protein n=1 Tax=Zalaria obscura TaxID=2024903 RepID=A0ACC3SQB8_9PEZI